MLRLFRRPGPPLIGAIALWLAAACGSRSAPQPVQRVVAKASVPVPSAPPSSSVPQQETVRREILQGVRRITSGGATETAEEIADPPLVHAVDIPAWLGGGTVFLSAKAIFFAERFTGKLLPLGSFSSPIDHVGFGSTGLVAFHADGRRWAWNPKERRFSTLPWVELLDLRAARNGIQAAVLSNGQVLTSENSGQSWSYLSGLYSERLVVSRDQVKIWAVSGSKWTVLPDWGPPRSTGPSEVSPGFEYPAEATRPASEVPGKRLVPFPARLAILPEKKLSCTGSRQVAWRTAPAGAASTTALGLGARSIPMPAEAIVESLRYVGTTQGSRLQFFGLGALPHQAQSSELESRYGLVAAHDADAPNGNMRGMGGDEVFQVNPRSLHNLYTWWWTVPFDPSSSVHSARLRVQDVLGSVPRKTESSGRYSGHLPFTFTSQRLVGAVPVLSAEGKGLSGVLLPGYPLTAWVQDSGVKLLWESTPDQSPPPIRGAIARGPNRIAVLSQSSPHGLVGEWTPPFVFKPLFELPDESAGSSSLAVDARRNLGILRLPAGDAPPGKDSPAAFLIPPAASADHKPSVSETAWVKAELAPWSALRVASAPECQAEQGGVRALFETPTPWLSVDDPSAQGMIALVRWTPSQVCLEAVMVGIYLTDGAVGGRGAYVARWIPKAEAAVVALTAGAEYRAALSCTLEAVNP